MVRQSVFEVSESLPESKRKSALALLVRKWSPFPSTQFAVHWAGHRACVYAWDNDRVAAAITAAGLSPARCTVWPETFFRLPMKDGFRLAAMTDGFEGQVWKDGFITASRWWPTEPSPRDWMTFLRAAGMPLTPETLAVPMPVSSDILAEPWTAPSTPVTDLWSLLQNEHAAAIAAAVVAAPFLYYLTQAAVLLIGTARVENAVAALSAENQTIRADRSAAFTNLDGIESYLSLEPLPSQFEIMNAAFALLKGSNVDVTEWSFDGGTLELMIQADRPLEAPSFIQMFEQDPTFSGVSGTVGNQQRNVRLSMQVEPRQWPTS